MRERYGRINMFKDIVKASRSYRGYDESYRFSREELEDFVDCARFAPSSVNAQPFRYYLAWENEEVDRIQKLTNWARQSSISGCRILKSVSFIRSVVGRVSMPGTVLRARRLAFPAITLISDLISNPGHHVPVRESEVRLLQCWWQPVCYTDHNA